ncbi:Hypothetical predicted protein [Pelobates cultripes]|uniref:Uncharacterized protein n=1 Tax=Pelobates cultripes TaxID=61616 RepID=A0AAD1R152_PELCU|nr:Hypothetical predicted protein [Pelobates cultripes]
MTTLLAGVADPTARPNDISNVFSLEPLGCNNPNDINNVFFSIQQLYKLQIKGYWEVTSLRHYLDQKLVPRGLRPEISTPDKVNTEDKLKEWNDILINCSYKLMQFLVKLEEENFEKVNKDLQNEVIKVKEFQSNSEYTLMENKLQNNIDNFTTHIKEKKHYKFQRDYKDFKEGTIFRQTKRSNIRANRKNSYSSGNTEWTDSDSGPTQGKNPSSGLKTPHSTRRGILKDPNKTVAFLDTPPPSTTVSSSGSTSFLDQAWPLPQRGRLRDRQRWGYKPNRSNSRN